jgi:hypothetical protein
MIGPMERKLGHELRAVLSAYCRATELEIATVAKRCAGDWRFFDRLDNPDKTFTVRLYDRVMKWFDANWPEAASWPADVPRPPEPKTSKKAA